MPDRAYTALGMGSETTPPADTAAIAARKAAVPTPLDKYQDQVQDISESYSKFQSFQYFCKPDLDIYLTETVSIYDAFADNL